MYCALQRLGVDDCHGHALVNSGRKSRVDTDVEVDEKSPTTFHCGQKYLLDAPDSPVDLCIFVAYIGI